MDVLSKGICTSQLTEIIKAEFINLISFEFTGKLNISKYAWTKAVCMYGEPKVKINNYDAKDQDVLKNIFYNGILGTTLQELVTSEKVYDNENPVQYLYINILNELKAKKLF